MSKREQKTHQAIASLMSFLQSFRILKNDIADHTDKAQQDLSTISHYLDQENSTHRTLTRQLNDVRTIIALQEENETLIRKRQELAKKIENLHEQNNQIKHEIQILTRKVKAPLLQTEEERKRLKEHIHFLKQIEKEIQKELAKNLNILIQEQHDDSCEPSAPPLSTQEHDTYR